MSGGIAQLVAIGAQDAHIVGRPEVSFFRSTYKRHTNFAQTVEKQVIQGNPVANGMSTVRFERKGDLLGYVYITNRNAPDLRTPQGWEAEISKVELLIGGQVIDTHDAVFSQRLAPFFSVRRTLSPIRPCRTAVALPRFTLYDSPFVRMRSLLSL